MDRLTIGFGIATVTLFIIAYIKAPSLAMSGVKIGASTLWRVLFLIIASMLVAGLIQVLIPKHAVVKFLGQPAGFKGVLIGSFIGAVMPGPPYASFPIAAGLLKAGAGMGAIVALITAWSLWQITRIPLEMALISPKFVFLRIIATIIFPPIAGLIAHVVSMRLGVP